MRAIMKKIPGLGRLVLALLVLVVVQQDTWAQESFEAKQMGDKVQLEWEPAKTRKGSHFTLQRSLDGKEFKSIALVFMAEDPGAISRYGYADRTSTAGNTRRIHYRLLMFDENEKLFHTMECSVDAAGSRKRPVIARKF